MAASKQSALPPFRDMVARGRENLRLPILIVRRRFERRPAIYPHIRWWPWALLSLALVIVGFIFMDHAVGHRFHRWGEIVGGASEIFTKLGLGYWYLIPPTAWLLVANQIDWTKLSRRDLFAVYKRTELAFFILIAVGLPGLLSVLLKYAIGRARPMYFDQLGTLAFHPFSGAEFASFPSGHSTIVGAAGAVLVLLFPRWKALTLMTTIWITATRIFVGAHYFSDAVAGYAFGFSLALVTAIVFARLGFVFKCVPGGLPVLRRTMGFDPYRREQDGDKPAVSPPSYQDLSRAGE